MLPREGEIESESSEDELYFERSGTPNSDDTSDLEELDLLESNHGNTMAPTHEEEWEDEGGTRDLSSPALELGSDGAVLQEIVAMLQAREEQAGRSEPPESNESEG